MHELANTGHISIEEAIDLPVSTGNYRNKTSRLIEGEPLRQGEHSADESCKSIVCDTSV